MFFFKEAGFEKSYEEFELIERLYTKRDLLRRIGHNDNDTYISSARQYSLGIFLSPIEYNLRDCRVYDENHTLVNLSEIRKAVEHFKPKLHQKKAYYTMLSIWNRWHHPFTFRYDPVPYTGGGSRYGRYYRTHVKKNKNYVANLQEYKDLFPNDRGITKEREHVSKWSDDFTSSKRGKSWKKQKKRKQWM